MVYVTLHHFYPEEIKQAGSELSQAQVLLKGIAEVGVEVVDEGDF